MKKRQGTLIPKFVDQFGKDVTLKPGFLLTGVLRKGFFILTVDTARNKPVYWTLKNGTTGVGREFSVACASVDAAINLWALAIRLLMTMTGLAACTSRPSSTADRWIIEARFRKRSS